VLSEASHRPKVSPATLLIEFITPAVVLSLGSEMAMKQSIRRRRQKLRPTDPETAADVLVSGAWTQTLDGKQWYLGETRVVDDKCHIFTTELKKTTFNVTIGHTYD